MSYQTYKNAIKRCLNSAAADFFYIGYCLREISEGALFLEDGYQSIWEFAKGEYNLSTSSASRFMAINAKFSLDGGKTMDPKFAGMGVSKLQEMLSLPDSELEKISQETTVKEIRAIKAAAKQQEEKQEATSCDVATGTGPIELTKKQEVQIHVEHTSEEPTDEEVLAFYRGMEYILPTVITSSTLKSRFQGGSGVHPNETVWKWSADNFGVYINDKKQIGWLQLSMKFTRIAREDAAAEPIDVDFKEVPEEVPEEAPEASREAPEPAESEPKVEPEEVSASPIEAEESGDTGALWRSVQEDDWEAPYKLRDIEDALEEKNREFSSWAEVGLDGFPKKSVQRLQVTLDALRYYYQGAMQASDEIGDCGILIRQVEAG